MKISLIVPVFNEEDAIPKFLQSVQDEFRNWSCDVEILFINDGSTDGTEKLLSVYESNNKLDLKSSSYTEEGRGILKIKRKSVEQNSTFSNHMTGEQEVKKYSIRVVQISFTRNFGKEAALCAGLRFATGDAVIPMDVDLQDPLWVVGAMIDDFRSGSEIVLAKRKDRSSDSYLKRVTADLFYKFHNLICEPKIEENVGDFRLLARSIVNEINKLEERNVFMKGMLSWVGSSNTTIINYTRAPRIAGKTKFNAWKLWNLAIDGITSFSIFPLKVWSYVGFSISLISFIFALYLIADKIFFGNPVKGYPSLMTAILFLGGIQLIGIGVLGEYLGRLYMEVKHRPRYVMKRKENVQNTTR